MPGSRPAAGGGRQVDVPPDRVTPWLANFTARHGTIQTTRTADGLRATATDGAVATLHLPLGWPTPPADASAPDDSAADDLAAAAGHAWRVGLLLVRRGAHAVGIALGDRLTESKVDTRYVQGRTAAGGWSQQRFARRRGNQTRDSLRAAADVAARLLLPAAGGLAALVTGGDRLLVDEVLADRRLAPLAALPRTPFLDVPEPRRVALEDAARRYRHLRVHILDPPA